MFHQRRLIARSSLLLFAAAQIGVGVGSMLNADRSDFTRANVFGTIISTLVFQIVCVYLFMEMRHGRKYGFAFCFISFFAFGATIFAFAALFLQFGRGGGTLVIIGLTCFAVLGIFSAIAVARAMLTAPP